MDGYRLFTTDCNTFPQQELQASWAAGCACASAAAAMPCMHQHLGPRPDPLQPARAPSPPSAPLLGSASPSPQLPHAHALQRFAADLAAQGQKVVPIVGPGIKIDPTYDVYLDGLQQNVYLKSSDSCQPYVGWVSAHRSAHAHGMPAPAPAAAPHKLQRFHRGRPAALFSAVAALCGAASHLRTTTSHLTTAAVLRPASPPPRPATWLQVWPGGVHFPDFGWNPDANTFWTEQLQKFSEAFNYSGIWTDMQESEAGPRGRCRAAPVLGVCGSTPPAWHRSRLAAAAHPLPPSLCLPPAPHLLPVCPCPLPFPQSPTSAPETSAPCPTNRRW